GACSPNPSIKISEEFNVAGPCIGAYLGGAYFNPNPHKTSKSLFFFVCGNLRREVVVGLFDV
ncbi:hypothetical protein, partial [Vibrio sp. SG41-7]|uniref:hypothetical protein n=1 Tax=Vibrio sp. SG41-7 TaxID=2760973 RepID=UPI001C7253C4